MAKFKTVKSRLDFLDQSLIDLDSALSFAPGGVIEAQVANGLQRVDYRRFTRLQDFQHLVTVGLGNTDALLSDVTMGSRIAIAPAENGQISESSQFSTTTVIQAPTAGSPQQKTMDYDFSAFSTFFPGYTYTVALELAPLSGPTPVSYVAQPSDSTLVDILTGLITELTVNGYTGRYTFSVVGAGDTLQVEANTPGDDYPVADGLVNTPGPNTISPTVTIPAFTAGDQTKIVEYSFTAIPLQTGDYYTLSLESPDIHGMQEIIYRAKDTDTTKEIVLDHVKDSVPTEFNSRYTITVVAPDTLRIESVETGDDFPTRDFEVRTVTETPADFSSIDFWWFNPVSKEWEISPDPETHNNDIFEFTRNVRTFDELKSNDGGFYFKFWINTDNLPGAPGPATHQINYFDFAYGVDNRPVFYFTEMLDSLNRPLPTVEPMEINNYVVVSSGSKDGNNVLYRLIIDHEESGKDWRQSRVFWRINGVEEEFQEVPAYIPRMDKQCTEADWVHSVRAYRLPPEIFEVVDTQIHLEAKLVDQDGLETFADQILILPNHRVPQIEEVLVSGVDTFDIPISDYTEIGGNIRITKASPTDYPQVVLGETLSVEQGVLTELRQVKEVTDTYIDIFGGIPPFNSGTPLTLRKTDEFGWYPAEATTISSGFFDFTDLNRGLLGDSSVLNLIEVNDVVRLAQLNAGGTDWTTIDIEVCRVGHSTGPTSSIEFTQGPYSLNGQGFSTNDSLSDYFNMANPLTLLRMEKNEHFEGTSTVVEHHYTDTIRPFRYVNDIELFDGASISRAYITSHDESTILIEFTTLTLPTLVEDIKAWSYDLSTLDLNDKVSEVDSIYERFVLFIEDNTAFANTQNCSKSISLPPYEVTLDIKEETTLNPLGIARVFNPKAPQPTNAILDPDYTQFNGFDSPYLNVMNSDFTAFQAGSSFNSGKFENYPQLKYGLQNQENSFQYIVGFTKMKLDQGQNSITVWTDDHFPKIVPVTVDTDGQVISIELTAKTAPILAEIAAIQATVDNIDTNVGSILTEVTAINAELVTVNTNLGLINSELVNVNTQLGTIITQVGDIQTDVGVIQGDVSTILSEVNQILTETQGLYPYIDGKTTDIINEVQATDCTAGISAVEVKVDLLDGKVTSLQSDTANIIGITTDTRDLAQDATFGFEATKNLLDQVNTTTVASRAVLDNASYGNASLSTKLGAIKIVVDDTLDQSQTNNAGINQVLTDTTNITSDINGVSAQIVSMQSDVDAIQTNVLQLASQNGTIESVVQDNNNIVTVINNAVAAMQGDVTLIKTDTSNLLADVSTLDSKVSTTQSAVNLIQADTGNILTDTANIRTDTTQLLTDLSAVDTTTASTNSGVGTLLGNEPTKITLISQIDTNVLTSLADTSQLKTDTAQILSTQSSTGPQIDGIEAGVNQLNVNLTSVTSTVNDTNLRVKDASTGLQAIKAVIDQILTDLTSHHSTVDGKLDNIQTSIDNLPLNTEIVQILDIVSSPTYGNEAIQLAVGALLSQVDFQAEIDQLKGAGYSSGTDSLAVQSVNLQTLVSGLYTVADIWNAPDRTLTEAVDLITDLRDQLDRIENNQADTLTYDKLHTPPVKGS